MTGLEKKLTDEVRKGSLPVDRARKALIETRYQPPFRNPVKTCAEEVVDENLKNM